MSIGSNKCCLTCYRMHLSSLWRGGSIIVEVSYQKRVLEVSVRDTGIEEEEQKGLFTLFGKMRTVGKG